MTLQLVSLDPFFYFSKKMICVHIMIYHTVKMTGEILAFLTGFDQTAKIKPVKIFAGLKSNGAQ